VVPFTNVVLTFQQIIQEPLSDGSLDNVGTGTSYTGIAGFLDLTDPKHAYESFNVVLQNPALCDISIPDFNTFYSMSDTTISEWQVTVTSASGTGALLNTVWAIQGRPQIYDAGLELDHAHLCLEMKTYPVSTPAVPTP